MRIDELQNKLLLAARALPVSDHVPYAFEKRILAALNSQAPLDIWAFWSRLLWRAAAPCVGIMLVLGVWTVVASSSGTASASLAADLDRTVWGPLIAINESW
jgi:hypothetical protein